MVFLNLSYKDFIVHVLFENNYFNKYCFRHWSYNEPNGYPSQMCLYVYVNGDYPAHRHFWVDVDCRILYRYICEVNPAGVKVI